MLTLSQKAGEGSPWTAQLLQRLSVFLSLMQHVLVLPRILSNKLHTVEIIIVLLAGVAFFAARVGGNLRSIGRCWRFPTHPEDLRQTVPFRIYPECFLSICPPGLVIRPFSPIFMCRMFFSMIWRVRVSSARDSAWTPFFRLSGDHVNDMCVSRFSHFQFVLIK